MEDIFVKSIQESQLRDQIIKSNISEGLTPERAESMIISNFEKGEISEEIFLSGMNILEKAKKGNIGEIREWKSGKYRKTANGWEPVKGETKSSEKKEEPKGPAQQKDIYSDLTSEQRTKIKEVKASTPEEIARAKTIITFKDQKSLNLFVNEIVGQISDGMWENSRGTEWMWKSVAYKLGDKNEVIHLGEPGKKSFPYNKDLDDVIGERAQEEAGYATREQMKQAWREINTAIGTARRPNENELKFIQKQRDIDKKNVEDKKKLIFKDLTKQGYLHPYSFESQKSLGELNGGDIKITVDTTKLVDSTGVERNLIVGVNYYRGINPFSQKISIPKEKLNDFEQIIKETLEKLNK